MENEAWKDIPDYEGLYQVSNLGNVRNKKTKKLLKYKNVIYLELKNIVTLDLLVI